MLEEHRGSIWDKMAQVSPDIFCTFNLNGEILHINDAGKNILGYEKEELINSHYSKFIHPDYVDTSEETRALLFKGSVSNRFENCFIHKAGRIVFIQWSSTWFEEEQKYFAVGRDITEQKIKEHQYKAIINNNSDIIYTENPDGLITDVNESFCSAFGVSKEAIIKQNLTSYLLPENIPVHFTTFQFALTGSQISFTHEFSNKEKGNEIFEIYKTPIHLNSVVVGIQTIVKDITPIVKSFRTIRHQANKLNTIFESITDCFFTLDNDWNLTYINRHAAEILRIDQEQPIGKNIWKLFPHECNGKFHQQYNYAINTGTCVHFEAFYALIATWFEVKAFPSADGLSVYFHDVTDKINSRKELEKLSLVASKTNNGVIITNQAREIEWVNEGFTRLTGYCLEEVAGKIPSDFLHDHTSDVKAFEAVKEKMLQGEPVSFEMLNTRKTGEKIWLSIQVNPIFNKAGKLERYITIQTDITERYKTQQELEKLSLVASKTNNSVLIADKDFRIEWVNEGFSKLTGYSLEEAIGKKPSELLNGPKTDQKHFEHLEQRLRNETPISFEIINYKKNGEEVWVSLEINAVYDENGIPSRFIEVQTDITALKNSEIQLTKLANDLYRQNKDLQQFAYIVSHNLRSPVANALGLANLLPKLDKQTELYDTSLKYVKQSIFQLDTVLRDLNDILSIRDKKGSLELESVNLKKVIQQAFLSLQEPFQNCGACILTEFKDDLCIRASKAYLYSIFYNLLSNAIKYRAQDRKLKVTVKCLAQSAKGTIISFQDNGSGFDIKKAKDNIFKLYKRFHADSRGRGIGLYLIKTHLEAMDGHIEVTSNKGSGTKFLIYLPN